MALRLVEGDFESFFRAPFACHGRDAFVASPLKRDLAAMLDPARNPMLQRGRADLTWFTAHVGDRIVGRITAHVHHASNRRHGWRRGHFGLFECIDDVGVARALLGAAEAWTRARGCNELAGPFNLAITGMVGAVTQGFDHRPYTYQDWSPPHVARLLAALGYAPFAPMRTFEVRTGEVAPERLLGPRQHALLADPEWTFSTVSRRHLAAGMRDACGLLNDGFAGNPMFVPMTVEEFAFSGDGLSMVMDESLSWIARHRGVPAGVVLCIPDLNPMLHAMRYRIGWTAPACFLRHRFARRKRAALLFYSVAREFQQGGVCGVLLAKMLEALRAGGYERLGISWISDGNAASLRQVEKLGGRPLHRLHLFRRAIA